MLNVTDEEGAWERVFGEEKHFVKLENICLSGKHSKSIEDEKQDRMPIRCNRGYSETDQGVFETQLYKSCLPMLKTQFSPLSFAQSLLGMGKKVHAKKNDKKGQ